MGSNTQNLSLGEAASRFLAGLPEEARLPSQQEIYKFVRWFGQGRSLSGLAAAEVTNYAEQLSSSDTDYTKKIELLKAFLAYIKKEGWTNINLAAHLKAKKSKTRLPASSRLELPQYLSLTQERYDEMKAELEALVDKYIANCEAKSALLSSKSENIRRTATLACLKATYCRHHRKELIDEMVKQNIEPKPYKVRRFLSEKFLDAVPDYNLATR